MRFTTTERSTADALARVQITETERRAAEHYMELGERIADFIVGAVAAVRSVMQGVERGLRALAGIKSTS